MTETSFLPLCTATTLVVGRALHGDVTARELLQRAAVVARALPAPEAGRWLALAFGADRLAFVATLLAAWHGGHAVMIVEDARRERIAPALQHPDTALLLHDTGAGRRLRVPPLFDGANLDDETPLDGAAIDRRLRAPDAPALAVQLHDERGRTSLRSWSGPALLSAIDALAERLPLATGQRLLHCCTPGFLPALFAGCLLPLRRGGVLDLIAGRDASALAAASREPEVAGVLCDVLTLRTMAAGGEHGRPAAGVPLWSTAPLPPGLHLAPLRAAPLSLPPAIAATSDTPPIGHAAAIDSLRRCAGVHDVDAVPVPDAPVVVAAAAGPGATAAIRDADRALPDGRELRWVAFDVMPRDPNGRLCTADVWLRAGRGRDGRAVLRTLDWQRVPDDDAAVAVLRTTMPRDYLFFEGHFTGYPVLAGAVQLQELVVARLVDLCGELPPLELIDGIKFLQRIAPGDAIALRLQRSDDARKISFEVSRDGARCTAGRAVFTAALPAFRS
ncbi:MAG: hypothetical protein H6835_05465 [Planctomycetes bacterium]|nr:hypothetical protein [Planctomycetota bacterium]